MQNGINFDVSDAPTIAEFLRSDAFIRGLMGPFSSGKSSGCLFDIIHRGLRQTPAADGIRRTRWVIVRNCYDEDTEILTEARGWVFFAELLPTDRVATLKDGALTFEVPTHYYAARYQGEMVGVLNEGIDLLVTPEHHLWVTKTFGRDRQPTAYRHETASECYGITYWQMKKDAAWVGEAQDRSLDFFEFLGFWFAEGYAGVYDYGDRATPHHRLTLSQKRNVDYVRDLLNRVGFKWGEHDKGGGNLNFVLALTDEVKALARELALCGKARTKAVPLWIKQADREHLLAFLRGYLEGDGHIRTRPNDTTRAYTASPQLADDLQEIALKAGLVATVRPCVPEVRGWSTGQPQYLVTFLQPSRYEPMVHDGWYKRPYDGMVYCVEVSTHVVYVRRNGVAVWCGQTYRQLTDTSIKTVHQWFPPPLMGRWRATEHEYMLDKLIAPGDRFPAQIELLFRALDRPDHVRNLLSMELTGAWVNEAREVPWSIIEALTGRVDRYPARRDGGATWAGVILDTNPPDTESDWFKFFEERDHTEAVAALAEHIPGLTVDTYSRIFKQPAGRSPLAENTRNNVPGYWHRLAIGKDPEWIKVYVDGDYGFVIDGRPVFEDYHDAVHCPGSEDPKRAPRTDPRLPIHRGWDFGLTPACVFSQLSPRGTWKVVDELVATSMGVDRFGDQVLNHSARHFPDSEFEDVGDPAGEARGETDERSCFDLLHAKGIDITGGLQSPIIRQDCVRRPLKTLDEDGSPAFNIHPRCKITRRGLMGGYHLRKIELAGRGPRYADKPEKNSYSHPVEAMCYTATRLFGSALQSRASSADPDDVELNSRLMTDRTRSLITGY